MPPLLFITFALMAIFNLGTAFVSIIPQFDTSNIGPNVIVHDAIMINSSQTLIISYNKNGAQYISKYFVQTGSLVEQLTFPITTYIGIDQAVTVLCVDSLQTQVMAFTGSSYYLFLFDIPTIGKITHSLTNVNIIQMIWSPVNNYVYFVDDIGDFGYINHNNLNVDYLNGISSGILRMSASLNFSYMAITSVMEQKVFIYNLTSNSLLIIQPIVGLNTIAHQWFSDSILYVMPATSGYFFTYDVSSTTLNQYNCFADGTYDVFSFHIYRLSNGSQQYIIGSSSGTTLNFLQFDLNTLTVTMNFQTTYSQNLIQIKYSTNQPEKSLLIFTSYINALYIVAQCQIGEIYDSILNQCVNTTVNATINATINATVNATINATGNVTGNATTSAVINSTINVTINSTINTTLNSTSNATLNATINTTNLNQMNNAVTQLSIQQQKLLTNLISIDLSNSLIKTCNQIPGNRRLFQSFFNFFVNFDDIQLYIYHQKEYDFALNSLLNSIQTLQNQKWNIIKFQVLWGLIGVNTTFIKENFDTKVNYTSWKFLQVQGNSSGFMINTLNFFLSNIFLIFLMFLLFRITFFILFKYQFSKFLRQYSFWPYLYFMMIDGNLQFLSYMYLCELQHFFSSKFSSKCQLIFMICIFLVVILLINCSHLLLRQIYSSLAKYFFDDTKTSIQASIFLILQFGYRNFILGAVHALFNYNYTLKISLLITVQIFFLINNLTFLRKRNFCINQTRITVNSIAVILRIYMLLTFFINQQNFNFQQMTPLEAILQKAHFTIIVTYLAIGIFSTVFQVSKLVYKILVFVMNKFKQKMLQFNKGESIKCFHLISKQKEIENRFLQQFGFKQQINANQGKIQPKKEVKKSISPRRIRHKKKLNKILQIKQIQESNKGFQNVIFAQIKQM